MNEPMRLGSSAFNASYISGAGIIPTSCYRELWNWVTDLRNLRCAWRKIASNQGQSHRRDRRDDGGRIRTVQGSEVFLGKLRNDLRAGRYRPSPCRRKLIPKPRQPGKFRPLGIPTITDRVVQAAVKNLLEPIFEAHFWHVSYGFRPGRGCHGALEHIRLAMRPTGEGRRRPTPSGTLSMGHRGRHQGLFRSYRSPSADGAHSRSRRRSEGDETGSAVLESRRVRRRISFFRRAKARPKAE